MAVVVKNTFLHVERNNLYCESETFAPARRCHSLPRDWKPTKAGHLSVYDAMDSPMSARSELSFYSVVESESCDSNDWNLCPLIRSNFDPSQETAASSRSGGLDSCGSSCDWDEAEAFQQDGSEAEAGSIVNAHWADLDFDEAHATKDPCMQYCGACTPTSDATTDAYMQYCGTCTPESSLSPLNSPREITGLHLTSFEPLASNSLSHQRDDYKELENQPRPYMQANLVASTLHPRTRLNTAAPAFQPVSSLNAAAPAFQPVSSFGCGSLAKPQQVAKQESNRTLPVEEASSCELCQSPVEDNSMESVVSCLQFVLSSCGVLKNIKIFPGSTGTSATLVSAEMLRIPNNDHSTSSQCYEIMEMSKHALQGITSQLPTITLLSARVQKEVFGYTMRSSIACLPDAADDEICWDMFLKGSCPRSYGQCRWYHPGPCDIARIKVSIRYIDDVGSVASQELPRASSAVVVHKISLGDLV